jgi:very-short-patch-repair endonuclease
MSSHVDEAIAAIAASQACAFSRSQLYEVGGSRELLRRRVRARVWVMRGEHVIALAAAPQTWEHELWVAHLQAGPRSAITARASLALLGLRNFGPGPVDVLRHERRWHDSELSADLHMTSFLPDHHITQVGGLACTTLARSLFVLASMSSPKRRRRGWSYVPKSTVARAVADARVHHNLRPIDLERIVAEVGVRGRAGTTLMRQLSDEHAEGTVATESELEDLHLRVTTAHALPAPVKQTTLRLMSGEARVDFCYPEAKLIIECDGRKYHSALQDMDRDRWRGNELAADGWRVIRVSWFDLVHQPEKVVKLIRRALRSAGLPDRIAA